MTIDQLMFVSEPDAFDAVDWNDERPSESLSDRLERLNYEMMLLTKYDCDIPDRLTSEYSEALAEWMVEYEKEWERVKFAMENAPIGTIEDYV